MNDERLTSANHGRGNGVGRGLGVGVGLCGGVGVGVPGVGVGVGVGVAVGVGVGVPPPPQSDFSTMLVSVLLSIFPVTTIRLFPTGVPAVKECATFVFGPVLQLSATVS